MSAEGTKVGELRRGGEKRDAIHIAVAPAHTMERLYPGQRVGLSNESTNYFSARAHTMLGIVDPFLDHAVEPGEQFWVFLYPNSITGLNHVWTHPAFPGEEVAPALLAPSRVKEAAEPSVGLAENVKSRQWIDNYARELDTYVSGGELIEAAKRYLKDGDYLSVGDNEDAYLNDEFWDHFQLVTGQIVTAGQRGSFFSCSC